MAKQVLIEEISRSREVTLDESVQPTEKSLGTIKGICADYANATRNGNFYSRKLWENVFKDPLVKEALEDRVLLGELDHPIDGRLEASAANACIVMTGYEFDDKEQVLRGSFDILPTPSGKVLRSLLDYGCRLGLSSRGEGDVTVDDQGKNVVAEDGSYYFVGFDAVAMPAVKKAKPALQESLSKRLTFKESLSEQISSASTKSELDLIKNVIEATELPDSDSLLESINIKSKELEGVNNSSNLMEDLENANSQIEGLKENIRNLKQEVINNESRFNEVSDVNQRLRESLKKKRKEVSDLNEQLSAKSFEYIGTSKTLENTESSLKSLEESCNKYESKISSYEQTIQRLQEKLRVNDTKISESESRVRNLEESLEKSQKTLRDRTQTVKELQERVKEYEGKVDSLTENLKNEKLNSNKVFRRERDEAIKLRKENQKVLENYAVNRAKDLGLNSKTILESIQSAKTTSEIDKILAEEVDRKDRYRKVPIVNDGLINSLSKGTLSIKSSNKNIKPSEEDAQTLEFMESVMGKKIN